MSDYINIKLTKSDLNAIEAETLLLAGAEPTIENLKESGLTENTGLIRLLDVIADIGRLITLLIAQIVQSVGAVLIALVFGILEYERVRHGAKALGQSDEGAVLIALAVVSANFILPIYALRALVGQRDVMVNRATLRGWGESFWNRLVGKPSQHAVNAYHNPTLHVAGMVITWATILLALYDVLSPLITQMSLGVVMRELADGTEVAHPPLLILTEFVAGVGLSIGGVFFLQSASHEIGVSTITNQPKRLSDVLEVKQSEWQARRDEIRNDVRTRYMTAKANEVAKAKNNPLSDTTTAYGKNPLMLGDPQSMQTDAKLSASQWHDIANASVLEMKTKE